MRATQLVKGNAYDLERYGKGVYVGYDHDPEGKGKPYVLHIESRSSDFDAHMAAVKVLRTWDEAEAEAERNRERAGQRKTNERALIEFFEKQGLSAARKSVLNPDRDLHVRLVVSEDIDYSTLEMRWSTLQELLANAREVSHDLVAGEAKAK